MADVELVIKIPKEFEEHFNSDRFEDSLQRCRYDIKKARIRKETTLSGRYEIELLDMLTEAFLNGTQLESQRWTPVSENLPKEFICDDGYVEPSDYVLVWGNHGNYGVSRYWGNRKSKTENPNSYKDWMDLDWVVQKPIAWMPLPEPYKAESEE